MRENTIVQKRNMTKLSYLIIGTRYSNLIIGIYSLVQTITRRVPIGTSCFFNEVNSLEQVDLNNTYQYSVHTHYGKLYSFY